MEGNTKCVFAQFFTCSGMHYKFIKDTNGGREMILTTSECDNT